MSLKWKSEAKAVAVVGLVLFCGSCGDVYRPVANPVLQPGGDPQRTAHALVVSSNGPNQGTAVIIDVSGDTVVGSFTVGRNPVHAAFILGTDYIVNQADHNVNALIVPVAGSQTDPSNSIITLPGPPPSGAASASPVFAAPAGGKLFVTEPGLVAPSCNGPGNCVADISPASNSVNRHIPVGSNPVALVATPDGTQLYSLNQGDNTVSVIFPATDQNVATINLPAGAKPVWGAVSSDGTRVFIVNQGSNNVSVIDTNTETVIQPNNPLPVGAGPNYITYQATLNRFYVTSPAGNSLSIIDNNTGTVLPPISLAGAPCNGQHPISVTALADGTRAYVADRDGNSVCVLNTTSNTFTKRICLVQDPATPAAPTAPCVGSATPVFIASNSDATRVYTANQYQTAPFAIASISRATTGVVTVTTTGSNPFVAGQPVTIAGVSDASYAGVFGITAVISSTQFTYSQTGLPASSFVGGTATVLPYVSIIQTAGDTTVKGSDGVTPLTIDAGGTPVFIAMTP
ncbi:MAG: YncE family protein [Terriglobales bacterium]